MSNNTPSLDLLVIDTHDVHTIGFADISFYPRGFQIISPSIQITPPSYPKVTLPFTSKNATFYNSNILEITCSEEECGMTPLPDGIWRIKYTITPSDKYFVEKTFLRTEQLQNKFGLAFLSLEGCSTPTIRERDLLDDVWLLIQGAIADGSNCNETATMNKYRLAEQLLTNLLKLKLK